MNTVHFNTIYPCMFLSNPKPKLIILHHHRSRCLRSLLVDARRTLHPNLVIGNISELHKTLHEFESNEYLAKQSSYYSGFGQVLD